MDEWDFRTESLSGPAAVRTYTSVTANRSLLNAWNEDLSSNKKEEEKELKTRVFFRHEQWFFTRTNEFMSCVQLLYVQCKTQMVNELRRNRHCLSLQGALSKKINVGLSYWSSGNDLALILAAST